MSGGEDGVVGFVSLGWVGVGGGGFDWFGEFCQWLGEGRGSRVRW